MRALKLLILIQGIALLFLLVPYSVDEPYYCNPFLLSKTVMPLRSYFYLMFNRVNQVLFYYIIYHLSTLKYKPYVFLFLAMEFLVLIEFFLSYNSSWFSLTFFGIDYKIGLSHFFIIFKALILGNVLWEQSK